MAKKGTALANVENDIALFDDQGATGLENVRKEDLLIPQLKIIQSLSPQVKKNKAEYIEEADIGMICDAGVGDLFEDEVALLPVFFTANYIEWEPNRGGFVQAHGADASILQQTERQEVNGRFVNVLENGNEIAEHADWYFLNLTAGNRKSWISMASTQLKASRQLITKITGQKLRREDGTTFTPPIWYRS